MRTEKTRLKAVFKSRVVTSSQKGVTLTELLIVAAIIGIVVTFSLPSLSSVVDNSRLKAAAQQLAGVYQDARLRATQNNTSYEVLIVPGVSPAQICIDLDGDGICGPGDPVTRFPSQITISNFGVPVPLNGNQLHFPVDNTETPAATGVAWNSRGLPCQLVAAGGACQPSAWVQHVQFQRSNGTILYGAVSVSPTGRVKTWIYSAGNGNAQWL